MDLYENSMYTNVQQSTVNLKISWLTSCRLYIADYLTPSSSYPSLSISHFTPPPPQSNEETEFSCTLVHKSMNEMDSHIFTNLSVGSQFLLHRSGHLSIHASSLLAAIRIQVHHRLNGGNDIPPVFRTIFNSTSQDTTICTQFDIATTRVPDFEQSLKNPLNGYRFLGNLGSFPFQTCMPTNLSRINPTEEILAVGAESSIPHASTVTSSFLSIWGPFGVTLDTHFILIFHPSSTRSISQPATSPNTTHPHTPLHEESLLRPARFFMSSHQSSPSCYTPIIPNSRSLSPLIYSETNTQANTSASTLTTPLNTIHSLNNSSVDNTTASPQAGILDISDYHIPIAEDNRFEVLGVDVALIALGITTEEQNAARYKAGNTLFPMVLNFYAFQYVLQKCGFEDRVISQDASFAPGTGLLKILTFFNWTKHSYKHKCTWYAFAKEAATMKWRENSTGNGV